MGIPLWQLQLEMALGVITLVISWVWLTETAALPILGTATAGFSERLVVYAGCLKITVLIVVNIQNASN